MGVKKDKKKKTDHSIQTCKLNYVNLKMYLCMYLFEDVPLVEFMYLVRVTVGDSGPCCICVTYFEH